MIVIEGPVETDLIDVGLHLRDHWAYSLRRYQVEPNMFAGNLLHLLADAQPRLCLLRSHLSDVVRLAFLGYHPERCEAWRQVELCALALGAVVLVVLPDGDVAEEDLPLELRHFDSARVVDWYRDGAAHEIRGGWRTRLPTVRATRSELLGPGSPVLQESLDLARRLEALAQGRPPPSLATGSVKPQFLVIGEGPAPGVCPLTGAGDAPDLPFSRGPASQLLWRAVDEVGLRWEEGAWCNASTFRPEVGRWSLLDSLDPEETVERILCLGKVAELCVKNALGWWLEPHKRIGRVRTIHHPAHVRVFRGREFNRFKVELGEFLAPWVEGCADVLRTAGTCENEGENDGDDGTEQ
jgi:hypothetical protein